MAPPGKGPKAQAGIEPRSAPLEADTYHQANETVVKIKMFVKFCSLGNYVAVGFHAAGSRLVDYLVVPVVKASASRAEDPGFESRLRRDFFGVESYQ